MKKITFAALALLACVAIVLPVISAVNPSGSLPAQPLLERADGNPPVPPILPPWTSAPAAEV